MDDGTDADPVLRSLGEDLARDDPRLAAMLAGTAVPRRHRGRGLVTILLVTPALLTVALLLPPTVALGAVALLLAVASPVAVWWLCDDGRPAPRLR